MSPSPPERSTRVAPTAPLQSLPYDSLGMDAESFKGGILGHLEYTLAEVKSKGYLKGAASSCEADTLTRSWLSRCWSIRPST